MTFYQTIYLHLQLACEHMRLDLGLVLTDLALAATHLWSLSSPCLQPAGEMTLSTDSSSAGHELWTQNVAMGGMRYRPNDVKHPTQT